MKRPVGVSLLVTTGLVAVFYLGVWFLPHFVRWVATRSLYNYRDQAEEAIARGDYDRAVAIIERASREIPRDIYFERPEFMYDWIGQIRQQQGRTTESLEAFLRAQAKYFVNIELRGYFPPPRLIRDIIESYFAVSNPAGAYQEVLAALAFYPMLKDQLVEPHARRVYSSPASMRDTGILYIKTGRLTEGQARVRESAERNPRLPDSRFWLGQLAEQMDSPETAIQEYEAELAVNPFAENALLRLIALQGRANADITSLTRRLREMHSRALAEYVAASAESSLVILWGIGSKFESAFDLSQQSDLLFNILARSTPCDGLYGWFEFTLDGRHVQNVYVESPELHVYSIWLKGVAAGHHTFRLEALSDAMDGSDDRNTYIQTIRIYRAEAAGW